MASCTFSIRPDGVAVLLIDQPNSRANVLTSGLWTDLDTAVQEIGLTPGVTGLIVASAKPGIFIAGADLKLLGNAPAPNDPAVTAYIHFGLTVLERLESLPFATIAAIDGAALGGGLEVALACDFRIVGTNPRVQLGLPETTLGLIPGWGGTQRLPRIVGLELAAMMLSTARSLTANEAVDSDLALDQIHSENLIDAAAAVLLNLTGTLKQQARSLKQKPVPDADQETFLPTIPDKPSAVREAFVVMMTGAALPLAEALPIETEVFLRLAGSADSRERIREFFARKK